MDKICASIAYKKTRGTPGTLRSSSCEGRGAGDARERRQRYSNFVSNRSRLAEPRASYAALPRTPRV
ncbi:hypothetical protein EVAR_27911_1 [Eumeta japonica]|uniref:Uncharacterized protein n=1 Tax=Eumeta variegata TaxID=151549 RepID=A0A4C1UV29_EUMVA|nr:hypothetical protein EVAR_27911_1 [Eumeta japonica]